MTTFLFFFWDGLGGPSVQTFGPIEYTIPASRLEYTIPDKRMEFTIDRP